MARSHQPEDHADRCEGSPSTGVPQVHEMDHAVPAASARHAAADARRIPRRADDRHCAGAKRGRSEAVAASRRPLRSRNAPIGRPAQLTSTRTSFNWDWTSKPESRKTSDHRPVIGHGRRLKPFEPLAEANAANRSSRSGRSSPGADRQPQCDLGGRSVIGMRRPRRCAVVPGRDRRYVRLCVGSRPCRTFDYSRAARPREEAMPPIRATVVKEPGIACGLTRWRYSV